MSNQTKLNQIIRDHLMMLNDDYYQDVLETLPSLKHPAIRLEVLVLMKHRIQTGVWDYSIDDEGEIDPEVILKWKDSGTDLKEIAKDQISEVKRWLDELEHFLLNDFPSDQVTNNLPLTSGVIVREYETQIESSITKIIDKYKEEYPDLFEFSEPLQTQNKDQGSIY
jgi:hypothetical protein